MEKKGQIGHIIRLGFIILIASIVVISCKEDPKSIAPQKLTVPIFNEDSAYVFIEKQLSFGPRVPGTEAQIQTRDWYVKKLKSYGAKVTVQEFEATIFNGETKTGYNIMAQFNPRKKERVLLGAHWDTRIVADKDQTRQDEPIMGADDGASGVAALLEIARNIQSDPINLGVDILLFDLEDQGDLNDTPQSDQTDTYALGSLHWAKNTVPKNYTAKFGILLDMIGAKGAIFGREQWSAAQAGVYQDKIWKAGQNMGHQHLFQDFNAGAIGDDHVNVIKYARIPMVDIINRPMKTESGFGHYHHTHKDDISIIDKATLKAVGQVVTAVIYREAAGRF